MSAILLAQVVEALARGTLTIVDLTRPLGPSTVIGLPAIGTDAGQGRFDPPFPITHPLRVLAIVPS